MRQPRYSIANLTLAGVALCVWPLRAVAQAPEPEAYSLGRAIAVALANSQTLADAELGVRIARQQVREAWSSVLPEVRASAQYDRNLRVQQAFLPALIFDPNASPDDLIPVRFGADNTWRAGLDVSQPLFEVAAFIGVGAAGRFRALQREVRRGTAQQVVSTVRQAYFAALLADEELRLTERSIERVRQTLSETQAMNRAGLASEYDVLRLDVQHANLAANLERAQNAATAAKRALLVEMGLDPNAPIALAGALSEMNLVETSANDAANQELLHLAGPAVSADSSYDAWWRTAANERSDLRQLESMVLLEEARAAVERAEFFPKISLFTNYSVTAQENGSPSFFGETAQQRTSTAIAGLRVELPVFTGFSRSARVAQASAQAEQNELRLEQARLRAEHEVRTLVDNVHEARRRAAVQRGAVAQARRGFAIAAAEYREGVGSQLQVTDAEVALRESEFNYAQAVFDYLTARARLDLAMGTVPEAAGEFQPSGSN